MCSVSSLVLLAGFEGDDKPEFGDVLKGQVKSLRDQLDKNKDKKLSQFNRAAAVPAGAPASPPQPSTGRMTQVDERSLGLARIWDAASGAIGRMPGAMPASVDPRVAGAEPHAREPRNLGPILSFGKSFV